VRREAAEGPRVDPADRASLRLDGAIGFRLDLAARNGAGLEHADVAVVDPLGGGWRGSHGGDRKEAGGREAADKCGGHASPPQPELGTIILRFAEVKSRHNPVVSHCDTARYPSPKIHSTAFSAWIRVES